MGALPAAVKVPVSVTGPFVEALHSAVPFVESLALLIWMAAASGFDQLPKTLTPIAVAGHPGGTFGAVDPIN